MTRAFAHAVLCSTLFIASAASAAAQTRPRPGPAPPPDASPTPTPGASAREDFQLDITQRRITESDFQAATEVSAGDAQTGGFDLRVGAQVRAADIDVLLRNVRGHVRFRASMELIVRLLDARGGRN